ncbi:MAG TPA: threonine--tRNA ligase [Candidatus Paceibacterota bacterium]
MKIGTKESSLEDIRHSLAHVLAMAVLKKFPKAKLGVGPVVENGFYYDFLPPLPITDKDLPELENSMREIIKQNLPFTGKKTSALEAKRKFKSQPFKLELISDFIKEKKPLTVYKTGDTFEDLCRGGHVKNTNEIPLDALKLLKTAGAYWKGDKKNKQLTRIYGLAFESREKLNGFLKMREEAEKRDHRKLGTELDLFVFSDLVGAGLPLWTPKGTTLRNLLDDFVWELRKARGYERVDIPHITKKELYETSGHWDKFKNELLHITTREGHEFAVKPMNCPHHIQIYSRKKWSYRELPQRYASTTKVYRDEQTGELHGLSRVRSITQDDAHVFCRESQAEEEISNIWDIVHEFYKGVGFGELKVRLSLHDPKHSKNYLGKPAVWKRAESQLREVIKKKGVKSMEALGEAAFYGPKIDFLAHDSIGREWQVATIQLDMNMPERFNLTCVNESGKTERIVMLHAAIMGAIERFLSILIEHYAGAFPLWISPVQAMILPVSEKVAGYAKEVMGELKTANVRTEIDESNETLGKRIREAKLQKIPYIVVVGEKEKQSGLVSAQSRSRDLGVIPTKKFIDLISREVSEKK